MMLALAKTILPIGLTAFFSIVGLHAAGSTPRAICHLQVGYAQAGQYAAECPQGACSDGSCAEFVVEWTDAFGVEHVIKTCTCDESDEDIACQGWFEWIYSTPFDKDYGCYNHELCPIEHPCWFIEDDTTWPMRPAPKVTLCECL